MHVCNGCNSEIDGACTKGGMYRCDRCGDIMRDAVSYFHQSRMNNKPWQDRQHVYKTTKGELLTVDAKFAAVPHEDKIAAMTANLIIRSMVASDKDKL